MDNKITTELNVNETRIRVLRVENTDYVSLTDIAILKNANSPADAIIKWMSAKDSFDFYSLWEQINNPNFNFAHLSEIKKNEVGYNRFTMSPQRWKNDFNAIGIKPSGGKYSVGTFAHPDIAFEFASWIDVSFKLYLITEFQRLAKNEAYRNKIEWSVKRSIAASNYHIHTDAIKDYLIPKLTEKQKKYIYADEADMIKVGNYG